MLVLGFKKEAIDIFSADAVCGNASLVNQCCTQSSKIDYALPSVILVE